MFFRLVWFFVQLVSFTIIASVPTNDVRHDCIHFGEDSGYIQLLPTPVVQNNSVISMEIKAYNCEDISMTIYNGKDFTLTVHNEGMFNSRDGFELFGPCTGLWNKVKLELKEQQPYLYFGSRTSYRTVNNYNLNTLIDAFRDSPLYIGIHKHSNSWREVKSFPKPFDGLIRNVRFDNFGQPVDQRRLNGTLRTEECPRDVIFSSTAGAALLNENVTFNDNFRLYFEVRMMDCPECCSNSSILLSAISDDSYFILEIVENILKMKVKSGDEYDVLSLFSIYDYGQELCDGNWHRIALLQQGKDIRIVADHSSYSNNYALKMNFTAPLYIGQHPMFKILAPVGIRNGFRGCMRSLHINGPVPEIMEANLNEYVKVDTCNKRNILF